MRPKGVAEMATRWSVVGAMTIVLLGAQGCAAGLTLFGAGAGVSGGTGVSYTLDSVAYKTFTAPVEDLQGATLKTLKRMDITIKANKASESGSGRRIVAVAGDRDVEIELDRLTTKVSRMRVNAKQGWFWRDRATATEIIVQTAQTLEDHPLRANKVMQTAERDSPK